MVNQSISSIHISSRAKFSKQWSKDWIQLSPHFIKKNVLATQTTLIHFHIVFGILSTLQFYSGNKDHMT